MSRGRAVVTGASSGIGEAFARRLAADGHSLLLVARRDDRLAALAAELAGRHGVTADTLAADLAAPDGRAALRAAVDVGGVPELVVLNAGFGAIGPVAGVGRERQAQMVALNCEAVVDLAAHVLPAMVVRGSGTIVVVSSAAAWQPIPYTATYAATKAFELHFVEALAHELRGTGVRAIAACPGPVATEFGEAAGFGGESRWMPKETADGVVAATMAALARGRVRVATGWLARVSTLAATTLPRRPVVWAAGVLHRRLHPRE